MALDPIKIYIDGDPDGFDAAADQVEGRMSQFAEAASRQIAVMGEHFTKVGKAMLPISAAITAVGGAAFMLTKNAAGVGNAIDKGATAAGLSTDAYQELAFAIGQVSDLTDGQFGKAMEQLSRRMGRAADGNKPLLDAFEKINISQEDLQSGAVDTETAFQRLTEHLQGMETAPEAFAAASALMGEEAGRLGPILQQSGSEIDGLRDRAQELGVVMAGDMVKASVGFIDQMDELTTQFAAVKNELGVTLIPAMMSLMKVIQDKVIPGIQSAVEMVGKIAHWFGELPAPVQEAAGVIAAAFASAGPAMLALGTLTTVIGKLVAGTGPIGLFIGAATLLYLAWQKWGDDITRVIGKAVEWVSDKFNTLKEFISENFDTILLAMTGPIGLSIAAWREWGDDIMAAVGGAIDWVSEKFTAFVDYIQTIPAQLVQIGRDMIQGLIDGIMEKWEELKARVFAMAEALPAWMRDLLGIESPSRVFMEIGNQIGDGLALGIEQSQGLVRQAVEGLGTGAIAATDNMVDSILGSMGQLFSGSKKFAIAQALINTWQGATEALKLPWPANMAAFAKTLATGMGAVANIKSAQPGSSGGGARSGGSARTASGGGAMQSAPGQNIGITLVGDTFSRPSVEKLFEQINEGARRGLRIQGITIN